MQALCMPMCLDAVCCPCLCAACSITVSACSPMELTQLRNGDGTLRLPEPLTAYNAHKRLAAMCVHSSRCASRSTWAQLIRAGAARTHIRAPCRQQYVSHHSSSGRVPQGQTHLCLGQVQGAESLKLSKLWNCKNNQTTPAAHMVSVPKAHDGLRRLQGGPPGAAHKGVQAQ